MNCPTCNNRARRFGKDRKAHQRFQCVTCKITFIEPYPKTLEGMCIPEEKILLAVQCLVEGNAIRSTARIVGLEKRTVLRLLRIAGEWCSRVMDEKIRKVPVKHIEADEIWSFVTKKEAHKRPEEADNYFIGDAYTFVAIEATSKLVVCYTLGRRDGQTALEFIRKLARATSDVFQLTTDGFFAYRPAVEKVFGKNIAFAQLVKNFESHPLEAATAEHRYSPGKFVASTKTVICGNPNVRRISTSIVERSNLNIRLANRRFTRLTNGFSKKWENLNHALAIYFAHYNFCRIHLSLRVTPAMEAGITDHVWSLGELLASSGN